VTGAAAAPVGSAQPAALLIDADNFGDPAHILDAYNRLRQQVGSVQVCRAYGAAARLQALSAVWQKIGARTFPNLALEKNTTDAALIADAVALHFQQGIRLWAIASGDADFAPLAVRLREWGGTVWCFTVDGIVFAGAAAYYAKVVRFAPSRPSAPKAPAASAAPAAPCAKRPTAAAAKPAQVPSKPPAGVPKPPVAPSPALAAKAAPPLPAELPITFRRQHTVPLQRPEIHALRMALRDLSVDRVGVADVLRAVPELLQRKPLLLSGVYSRLRETGLLLPSASGLPIFQRHPAAFHLRPGQGATGLSVVYRG
jgi:hypothetical protein